MTRMYAHGLITLSWEPGCQEETGVLRGKWFELLKSNASGGLVRHHLSETVSGSAGTHSPGTRWGIWGAQKGRIGSVHRRRGRE